MTAEEILRSNEKSALSNHQIISHVTGKTSKLKVQKRAGSIGAGIFIIIVILISLGVFSYSNIPSAISEKLIETTDVQYADAVESKKIVFQQALINGEIPENTAQILKREGVLVGYFRDEQFIEANKHTGGLVLKMDDKIIAAQDFISEANTNIKLYNALNNATYSRAAYYYDDTAKEVFKRIGTNRNNYTGESDFDEVMNSVVGEGSNIDVNSVSLVKKTRQNEQTGEQEIYYEYEESGASASTNKNDAADFVESVRSKNPATNTEVAALSTADSLKVADTMSKERRSSLFYLAFMENISKMKAGEGNESKINEAMNFLYENNTTEVVDVETGEVKKVSGTPLESPSLYAILTDSEVDVSDVENYSSDRVLKTIENQLVDPDSANIIKGAVGSSSSKNKGSIGRFISDGINLASQSLVGLVTPTISSSLINNSYDTIKGVDAGEFLVEGAVNVGKSLAKAGGATAGDAVAAGQYLSLNNKILAMDAAADRMSRSPFDITSKNTFLGSIVYNFAMVSMKFKGSSWAGLKTFSKLTSSAISSLAPISYADTTTGYLTEYGDCETYATIGAVGSAHCSEIATYDTSTLDNIFNDLGFIAFVEANTRLDASKNRVIAPGSDLANFILYNNERETPLAVVDGGILESISNNSESVNLVTDILKMVKTFLGSNETSINIASGASFVNSADNKEWGKYKYAQRYVALARATALLRQYAGESTAYDNILYFEGKYNPVVAFLQDYYAMK